MNNSDKKWKIFERIVAAIHSGIDPDAKVKWNDKIDGRQFDVTIIFKKGFYNFLTVVECKDFKGKIPVEKVEAFATKSNNAHANKAILVSSNGFQRGCFQVAEKYGIDLYTLAQISMAKKEDIIPSFIPSFKVESLKLIGSDGKIFSFPDSLGRLSYLLKNTRIETESKTYYIGTFINSWIIRKSMILSKEYENFSIDFKHSATANIPQEDEPFIFHSISFNLSYSRVLKIKTYLDPHIYEKINSGFRYKNEISGTSHTFDSKQLKLKFDTEFVPGKFYCQPIIEFFYYCEKIEGGIAYLYLVESYQHGDLFQVSFRQSINYSCYYLEVTNLDIIKRLKKLLIELKSGKANNGMKKDGR